MPPGVEKMSGYIIMLTVLAKNRTELRLHVAPPFSSNAQFGEMKPLYYELFHVALLLACVAEISAGK